MSVSLSFSWESFFRELRPVLLSSSLFPGPGCCCLSGRNGDEREEKPKAEEIKWAEREGRAYGTKKKWERRLEREEREIKGQREEEEETGERE